MTTSAEVAVDVLLLLCRGRVAPALLRLARLPVLIRDDLRAAGAAGYEAGVAEGQRSLAAEIAGDAKPKRPRAPKNHEWLAAKITASELRERAKAVLRLTDELLDAVAAGGVGLSPDSWRRLRRALDG